MVNCIQSFVYLTFECIYDTARLKVSQQSVRIARTRNIDWVNMPIFMKPDFLNYTLELKKIKVYIYICIYFLFQLTTCNIHALFLCSFTDKETCQPAITIDTRRKRGFINAYVLLAMVTLSMLKFLFYIFLSLTGIKGIKIQRLGRDEFFANVYICHIVHIRSLNVVIFNGVVTVVKESRVFVARFRSWPS